MARYENPATPDNPVFDNEDEANEFIGKKKHLAAVRVGVVYQVQQTAAKPDEPVTPVETVGTSGNTTKAADTDNPGASLTTSPAPSSSK